jgi:hypothetical protein
MYKNMHNRIANLPQGTPNPWVNFFWMLLFIPSLLLLGGVVAVMLWAIAEFTFHSIFG